MPVVLVSLLRPLVIWVIQYALTISIADLVANFLQTITKAVARHYNIPETDAKVVVVNQLIDLAAILGVGAGVLASRLGLKAADYLGLKTTQAAKAALSADAAAKVKAADAVVGSESKARGVVASLFKGENLWKLFLSLTLVQQVGDWFIFGKSTLQGYLDAVFGKGTIELPTANTAPPGFAMKEFSDYAASLEAQGIVAIESQQMRASVVYSRDALAALLTWVYGQQLLNDKSTRLKTLEAAAVPYLVIPKSATGAAVPAPAAPVAPVALPPVRVFTGVLSSGTLGAAQPFNVRESDLINSKEELVQDAQNAAAAFLTALPGKIRYEIRITPNVTSSDGTRRTGETQRIVIGTLKSGAPRYKTLTNKFAVMDFYYIKPDGSRMKLYSATIGPTDVAQFNPTPSDLGSAALSVSSGIATTSIQDIKTIAQPAPLAASPLPASPSFDATKNYNTDTKLDGDTGYRFYKEFIGGQWEYEADPWLGNVPFGKTVITETEYRQATGDTKDYTNSGYRIVNNTPQKDPTAVPSPLKATPQGTAAEAAAATAMAKASATTLKDFYAAMSLPLPSVAERGSIYESLGLGAASLYIGTAAQNTKLLMTLQGKNAPTNTSGLYQIETSDAQGGYEMIFYPAGTTPDPSLRYPGSPAPSSSPLTWKPN